jgi:ubiquinone/menaquinone biosynthesis C-methylase UbiE
MDTPKSNKDVCSHKHAFVLDNFIRRIFQNPKKIVGEYINAGDTVIDLGCGPGFFTIDMAGMVGDKGRVIAVDLQKEMLAKLETKTRSKGVDHIVTPHLCPADGIGLDDGTAADFILAFYMVHETPDQRQFLEQVKKRLKPDGRFLLVEPVFHVSRTDFIETEKIATAAGFTVLDRPKKKGGRSLLLQ